MESDQQQSMMKSGRIFSSVGEVEILSDKKPRFFLRRVPDHVVVSSRESFILDAVCIMTEQMKIMNKLRRQVLINLDFHKIAES